MGITTFLREGSLLFTRCIMCLAEQACPFSSAQMLSYDPESPAYSSRCSEDNSRVRTFPVVSVGLGREGRAPPAKFWKPHI